MNKRCQVIHEKPEGRIGRQWDLLAPVSAYLTSTLFFTATIGNKKVKYRCEEKWKWQRGQRILVGYFSFDRLKYGYGHEFISDACAGLTRSVEK